MVTMDSGHQTIYRILGSTLGDGTSIDLTLATVVDYAHSGTVNVYPSPWGNIRPANVLASGFEAFVCVPMVPVASGSYFWGKVHGPCWTTVTSTWPLASTTDIELCFHMDGSLKMADEAFNGGVSNQIAGHVIVSGEYGDCLYMLQIE